MYVQAMIFPFDTEEDGVIIVYDFPFSSQAVFEASLLTRFRQEQVEWCEVIQGLVLTVVREPNRARLQFPVSWMMASISMRTLFSGLIARPDHSFPDGKSL